MVLPFFSIRPCPFVCCILPKNTNSPFWNKGTTISCPSANRNCMGVNTWYDFFVDCHQYWPMPLETTMMMRIPSNPSWPNSMIWHGFYKRINRHCFVKSYRKKNDDKRRHEQKLTKRHERKKKLLRGQQQQQLKHQQSSSCGSNALTNDTVVI